MVAKIKADTTDEEIVELTLKEKEYYLYLMERYEAKLLRYIMRLSNYSKEDAEDILQDVFIKAYLNLNDFDKTLKFSSWIYRICHNEVISFWRKRKAVPQNLALFENSLKLSTESTIYQNLDIKFNKTKIYEVLNKMPLKYRDILILRYFEEKDYKEIADILKKPLGTISVMLQRAKKVFKVTSKDMRIKF